ncbi:MAG: hypothetical protein D3908_06580 [Candidatus Electrothrix sp. AUS4]|nr:hypothetical protein [Candidatus Electrothrix sp. AUS4]
MQRRMDELYVIGTLRNLMQTITIPDFGTLTLATIVCDYNGTLAVDGVLLPGVKEAINKITDIQGCPSRGVTGMVTN